MPTPPVRSPYELTFMILSVLAGLGYLTTVPAPSSVAALMPGEVVAAWAWTLLLTGILGLVGCLWRGQLLVSLGLERSALLGQTGALLIIAGATLTAWATGQTAVFPLLGLGFMAAWMAANIWRLMQIRAGLRMLHLPAEDVP